MILSCTVTRGIWRFQPLIFDDTENTACSAMTSPYRQGVNSYIVHFHSLFQAFKTIIELDITYSLLKIFYQHIAIHGEHYLRARCWCSWPSQTLSATSRNVAEEVNLNVWKTGATSLIGIAGYVLWVLRGGRDVDGWWWMSMASVSLARGLQSVIIYFWVGKLSDSGVVKISVSSSFPCSGELGSAVASIFDVMCREFTFSWNWFWATKARHEVIQQ